jgi:GYF domain 2
MWYVAREGQTLGPVSFDQLRQGARDGLLRRDDFVWTEGMEQWAAAFTVPDLWPPQVKSEPPKAVSNPEAAKSASVVEPPTETATEPPAANAVTKNEALKRPNFILRHWRGEFTLAQAYWVVGLLVTIGAYATGAAIGVVADPAQIGARNHGIVITAFLFLLCAITVWQIVGVWRSAGNHIRSTKRYFWASLARVVMVLAAIRSVVDFGNIIGPMLSESTKLAMGVDDTPAHQLRLLRSATELELSGGMPFGTAAAMKQLLDAAPTVKLIHLNSRGGRVAEGYEIYRLIRERKLITYTSADCASACTIAFLAGPQRYLASNARLGFHSSSYGGLDEKVLPGINDEIRQTLRQHGVQAWFIEKALGTRGDSIWHPTSDELIRAGVVTKVVDASQFGLSGVTGWNDKEALERQILSIPLYQTLKENDPEGYKAVAQYFFDSMQAGKSAIEIANELRDLFGAKILQKYLRYGPDVELVAYWKTQIAEMQHLQTLDPVRCVEFNFPERRSKDFDLMKLLPEVLRNQDATSLAALMRATAQRPNDSKGASVQADLENVVASMVKENPRAHDVMLEPIRFAGEPKLLCSTFISFYRKILLLSPSRAGPLLRDIMKEGS